MPPTGKALDQFDQEVEQHEFHAFFRHDPAAVRFGDQDVGQGAITTRQFCAVV
jgi:hypothetical protein